MQPPCLYGEGAVSRRGVTRLSFCRQSGPESMSLRVTDRRGFLCQHTKGELTVALGKVLAAWLGVLKV